ncbi:MAG: 3-methyl-2-oxobutanoate dehydrogenase subunit beta [bacterium]|nr:MAG: 2-oxoisovalerate ferredoxin oxidoreductase, beta subunit [candidate division TA06 bacterium 32_111]KUK86847.1 MAG: 2-oxoisovalerate ferredoxin oxidoreductase, beta subunit [candidate division TA06 bacterium 34_109]MDI6700764.1 3-methyl-2-oxobutanoate dehydrogenase subunit beta [bacterium]
MKYSIPQKELMNPGHLACQGCGGALSLRLVLKTLGENTILTFPACCWSVIDGPFPYSSVKVPLFHTAFETAAITAAGIKAGAKKVEKEYVNAVAWAGDGGTYDIGIQALSGAAERNDDIFYFVYDNEAYMNTGVQRSSATPKGAWTTTTPTTFPKAEFKKDLDAIVAAHYVPYQATASPSYPEDLTKKLEKAVKIRGFKFFHILAPCPPGWKTNPEDTIKLGKLAVESGIFPLYEIENGEKYTINMPSPKKDLKPVNEYLTKQGRFRHLKEDDVKTIQEYVNKRWEKLKRLAGV